MNRYLNWPIEQWNRFFFEPTSPATIAIYRIFFGITIFITLLGKFPYRELFYSDKGLVSYETMSQYFPDTWLYFRWLPAEDPALLIYFLALMFATVTLIIGFQSRLSSIVVFLGMMSLSNRNIFVDNHGDDIQRICCLFLIFSDCGRAYSIDRWLRVKRGIEGAELPKCSPWAWRLIQLQVAYLYYCTFMLKAPGAGWHDGTAIYYALHYLDLKRFDLSHVFYYLWEIKLASWATMVAEGLLWSGIWFRRTRYWVVAMGFALHIGINFALNFPTFQYIMMASLMSFFYPEHVERVVTRFSGWLQNKSGRFNDRPAQAA